MVRTLPCSTKGTKYPGRYKLKLPFYHHELGRCRNQAAGRAWSHRGIASDKNRGMSSLKLASPTKECVLGTLWPSSLPKDEPKEIHYFLQVLNSPSFFHEQTPHPCSFEHKTRTHTHFKYPFLLLFVVLQTCSGFLVSAQMPDEKQCSTEVSLGSGLKGGRAWLWQRNVGSFTPQCT